MLSRLAEMWILTVHSYLLMAKCKTTAIIKDWN